MERAEQQKRVGGIIPQDMLEELARRNPDQRDNFLDTRSKLLEELNKPLKPRVGENANGAREVYDAQGKSTLPGEKARFEGEKATGNKEVDDAFDFTGFVRDFYLKEYDRNSIDGKGMKFVSTVNYAENGRPFENAFWNGSQMTYGRPAENSPLKTFVLLDVAAHEITHGVTEKESDFRYYGQSGALNESLSDVFGELTQQYSKNQLATDANWVVGDGIWKPGINGEGLRNMLKPGTAYDDPKVGKDRQPGHMKDYLKTTLDNGGVHTNSGIPNKAFATFARAVGGHAWEDPGHIWFAARRAAGNNPSFASFAQQTIEAAKSIAPQSVEQLRKAWAEVGVTPSATAVDSLTPLAADAGIPVLKPRDQTKNLRHRKAS